MAQIQTYQDKIPKNDSLGKENISQGGDQNTRFISGEAAES